MKIKTVPIGDVHHDPANSRTHDSRNLSTITASLKTFGQVEPLVVQAGTGKVIGGNGRLTAMIEMGMETVQIVEVEVGDVQAAALGIALNRTAELADWDDDALAETLAALQNDESIDELLAGFTGKEIEDLINQASGLLPDDADGKEFDESCADDVAMTECPHCGKEFPA